VSDETITLQEWVEAIQDVASVEKELRATQNPQRQQILFLERKEAVERVLAMRFLTGASTERIDAILKTEQWALDFYEGLSKETEDDMGQPDTQTGDNSESPTEAGDLPSWYSGASPLGDRGEIEG
jgi:hypothetical protein